MTPETREALEASIRHWETICVEDDLARISIGPSTCALCQKFHPQFVEDSDAPFCDGCPVRARTGKHHCGGSPYEEVPEAKMDWFSDSNNKEVFRAAARAELDFLKSLREMEK